MDTMDLLRLALTLALVVVLIFVAAWLLRRSRWMRTRSQTIKFISAYAIGHKSSVVIIEIEQQKLVLGVSPQQVNLLHILPTPSTFEQQLHQALDPSSGSTTDTSEKNTS